MAPALWIELCSWIIVLFGIIDGFCYAMYRFISNDTTEYDMEFLWDNKFRLKDLELDRKKRR